MLQWLEYRTSNEYVKQEYSTRALNVHYDRDNDIVIFKTVNASTFMREEAIDVLKDILKTLGEED